MKLHLTHVTAADVAKKLDEVSSASGTALGRVLTLIVMVPSESAVSSALDAANAASHAHPCRVIVVVPDTGDGNEDPSLSAEIRLGADAGLSEVAILRPRHGAGGNPESLVTPLLLPDTHITAWWSDQGPDSPSDHPIGALARRRITTSIASPDPLPVLHQLAAHYSPGDTDMAWAGTTLWRAYLAAMLDETPDEPVLAATVTGSYDHASTFLMASWLSLCLGIRARVEPSSGYGLEKMTLTQKHGELVMHRKVGESVASLSRPGRHTGQVRLDPRSTDHMLIEELQRMSGDDLYGEVLRAFHTENIDITAMD